VAGDNTDLSRFAEKTDLCRQYSLSPVKNLLALSLTPVKSLSPVSTTPAKNLSAVSLTPAITVFPGVVDTSQK
jgi:hypothetical protein